MHGAEDRQAVGWCRGGGVVCWGITQVGVGRIEGRVCCGGVVDGGG